MSPTASHLHAIRVAKVLTYHTYVLHFHCLILYVEEPTEFVLAGAVVKNFDETQTPCHLLFRENFVHLCNRPRWIKINEKSVDVLADNSESDVLGELSQGLSAYLYSYAPCTASLLGCLLFYLIPLDQRMGFLTTS